ncbi:hypothetical protein OESDEN_14734 [Oesophagostomum dentatum]|uniref:Uncharacterized protein n=1 Tax=Oesophagostomum dentatum TaxID=61180 RepID=A0A0B1SPV5_OESDE|nr:hypothetical protein OESDEN_14734 [Oesophagostomum dentatum]
MAILAYLNHKNTEIAKEIAANLYADTVEEAIRKYRASKEIFAEIGINLKECISNSNEVSSINDEDDKLYGEKQRLTKKDIVSQLNSVYDSPGLTSTSHENENVNA